MIMKKALEVKRRLNATSRRRLIMYCRNLSTDKDPKIHDDRMVQYLRSVARDEEWLEGVLNYLDSIGWNQSKYDYTHILDQLERFTLPDVKYFGWNQHFIHGKTKLIEEVSTWNLTSLRYGENCMIEDCLPRSDTHAGFSYILTGKKEKGMYREGLLREYMSEVEKAKKEGSFNKPILIGTRTQANNPFDSLTGEKNHEYKDKSRLVSMIDIYVIMAELVFAKRLQTKFSTLKWYAGGKNDTTIWQILMAWRNQYSHWLSIDYSKFDQSISAWLIYEAFDIMRQAYKHDKYFDEELFKIVREDFIHKVFIDGDCNLIQADRGVPSGSMFTQLVDSIVNRLMIDTYMHKLGISDYQMMIMGDDNIIFTNVEIDRDELSSYLLRNFGIEMHPSKCDYGKTSNSDPIFLSRYWRKNGVWRLPELLIAKIVYPERWRDYDRYGFTPDMIVQSYIDAFPEGMRHVISTKHREISLNNSRTLGEGRWLSGLMRYRLLYAS